MFLGLRGEPAPGRPRHAGRGGPAPGVGPGPSAGRPRGRRGLRRRARLQAAAPRPRVPRLREGGERRPARRLRGLPPRALRLAAGLRALHRGQGSARRRVVDGLGEGHPRAGAGGARPLAARARGGGAEPRVRPVPVLRAVEGPQARRQRAQRPRHGRHPDLRRPRQRRRVGAPRPVPADGGRQARVRGRRPAGLLQRHRPAVGKPAVPLGPHGGVGVRVVDRALPRHPRPGGPRARRPLPRVRGLLEGARRRRDGRARGMGEGARRAALRRGGEGARASCPSSPRTSA